MIYNDHDIFNQVLPDNPGEKHVACVLLVDTSGSMNTDESGIKPIDELNEGLKAFGDTLNNDGYAKGLVDVCILSFDDTVEEVIPFEPVNLFQAPVLTAAGTTAMNEAIIKGLEYIEQRKELYKQTSTPYNRPWLYLLTDGFPSNDDKEKEQTAIQRLNDAVSNGKVTFWPMGIGESADYNLLKKYNNGGVVLKAKAEHFKQAFVWLSQSMSELSRSRIGSEYIDIENPPETIQVL